MRRCVSLDCRLPSVKSKNFPGNYLPFGYKRCTNSRNSMSYKEYFEKTKQRFWKSQIPLIYINLDSHKDRKDNIKKKFSPLFHNIIRFNAIHKNSSETLDLKQIAYGADMNILAVFLSHYHAILKAKNMGFKKVIIIEDDADPYFLPFWTKSIDDHINSAPKGWHTIQLSITKVETKNYQFNPVYKKNIKGYANQPEWGAVVYAISEEGMNVIKNIDLEALYKRCPAMTADDCLLSFTPMFRLSGNTFNKTKQYSLHPPLFTVNVDSKLTHRSGMDVHRTVAVNSRCSSIYENVYWYNVDKLNQDNENLILFFLSIVLFPFIMGFYHWKKKSHTILKNKL
ncbi:MAG: hypothetical protein CMF41_03085 [Legionellales bacterium]|nr:hypothetical protein [Legionellales bacterium]OUX65384.1 MAG: hypothetical protein CBE41_01730 [Gammaproteobacteria bacterium TMED281]